VEFEFDPLKSETNKAKNGIDFVEAQALWRSKHVLLGAKDASEKRYMAIGRIGLDYFDVRKGRVVDPTSKTGREKFVYRIKRNAKRAAVVREKSGGYSKKK
jgi:hypothetical protein